MRLLELLGFVAVGALFGGAYLLIGLRPEVDIAYQDTFFQISGYLNGFLLCGFALAALLYVCLIRPNGQGWAQLAAHVSLAFFALGLACAGAAAHLAFTAPPDSDRDLLAAYNLNGRIERIGLLIAVSAAIAYLIITITACVLHKRLLNPRS